MVNSLVTSVFFVDEMTPNPPPDLLRACQSLQSILMEGVTCSQSTERTLWKMSHELYKELWCSHVLSFIVNMGLISLWMVVRHVVAGN